MSIFRATGGDLDTVAVEVVNFKSFHGNIFSICGKIETILQATVCREDGERIHFLCT